MNECVAAFLMLSLLGSGQTFLTRRSEKEVGIDLSEKYPSKSSIPSSMPLEAISTAYVCIEVSPNLPPCNFDKADYSIEEEDSSGDISERGKREVEIPNSFIVYKLEGCLPSRLPFRLPLCKPNEFFSPAAEVRRLYPFRTPGGPTNVPLIFPEFNHSQWLRLMKSMAYLPESSTEDKQNLVFELEDVREERVRPNRESKSNKPMKRKSKTPKKYTSKKILHQNDWSQSQKEETRQKKEEIFEFRPMMNEDMKKTLHKAQKRIEEDVQEARGLGQTLDRLVAELEFPYSRAIPYDPKKLQVAREGSEFPYSKAIPFDARKLQVARERSVFPYWQENPHKSGSFGVSSSLEDFDYPNEISYKDNFSSTKISHHSRRLQSVGKDQAVSFDFSMLEADKQGGAFSYSKEVPRDTSMNIEKRGKSLERQNQERKKTTRVPLRETDNHHTSIRSHRPRRLAEDSEHLESWTNRSRTLKTIKEGSEFPYSKAIPYDPKKLRPQSVRGETDFSKQSHHQSRKLRVIQTGREFPDTKAPFDSTKLDASKRKSELAKPQVETEQMNSQGYSFRKTLDLKNLSFALFMPHNRRASNRHSKYQRGKSS